MSISFGVAQTVAGQSQKRILQIGSVQVKLDYFTATRLRLVQHRRYLIKPAQSHSRAESGAIYIW